MIKPERVNVRLLTPLRDKPQAMSKWISTGVMAVLLSACISDTHYLNTNEKARSRAIPRF